MDQNLSRATRQQERFSFALCLASPSHKLFLGLTGNGQQVIDLYIYECTTIFIEPILGKLLVGVWGAFVFFMLAFYLSNLRSFIIAPMIEKPIDTLDQVAER